MNDKDMVLAIRRPRKRPTPGYIHLVLCYSGNQVFGIIPFEYECDARIYADAKQKASTDFDYTVDTRRIR